MSNVRTAAVAGVKVSNALNPTGDNVLRNFVKGVMISFEDEFVATRKATNAANDEALRDYLRNNSKS